MQVNAVWLFSLRLLLLELPQSVQAVAALLLPPVKMPTLRRLPRALQSGTRQQQRQEQQEKLQKL